MTCVIKSSRTTFQEVVLRILSVLLPAKASNFKEIQQLSCSFFQQLFFLIFKHFAFRMMCIPDPNIPI